MVDWVGIEPTSQALQASANPSQLPILSFLNDNWGDGRDSNPHLFASQAKALTIKLPSHQLSLI